MKRTAIILAAVLAGCAEGTYASEASVGDPIGDWTDCASVSDTFAPVEVYDHGARITDPYAPGSAVPAIGCAYREYGDAGTEVTGAITWAGWGPVEATPLLHIVPDAGTMGIGAWPAYDLVADDGNITPVMLLGTIGNPPEEFDVLNAGAFDHVQGTPRRIEIRSSGGYVSAWMSALDGGVMEEIVGATAIPTELQGSPFHGVAIDGHIATPDFFNPDIPPPYVTPDFPAVTGEIEVY